MKLMLFLILIFNIQVLYADELLNEKIRLFDKAKTFTEREQISSNLYFLANSYLESGNSGKALQYFRVALQMTPEHNDFIHNKIQKSVTVYLLSTKKIPPGNCKAIRSRYQFLSKFSPDKSAELFTHFPKCLDEKLRLADLDKKERDLKKERSEQERKSKLIGEKEQKLTKAEIDLARKERAINAKKRSLEGDLREFLNLVLPDVRKRDEKAIYADLGSEVEHIHYMNEFLPKEIIRTLQMDALKLVKVKTKKPKIDYNRVSKSETVLEVGYSLKILDNATVRKSFSERYKSLLDYKAGTNRLYVNRTMIRASDPVMRHISHNRFLDENRQRTRSYRGKDYHHLPVLPSHAVFKLNLNYDGHQIFLLLPGVFKTTNNSFRPTLYFEENRGRSSRYGREPKPKLMLPIRNELLKGLRSISIDVDIEATAELLKKLEGYRVSSFKDVSPMSLYLGEEKTLHGLMVERRKEGIFYVTQNGKIIETYLYNNNVRKKINNF